MTPDNGRACANCGHKQDTGAHLVCRRFPPTTVILNPGTPAQLNVTAWPIVQPFDLCGEHLYA